jgi:hypothetical protein
MALLKIENQQTPVSYELGRLSGINLTDTNIQLLTDVHQHEHTIKLLLTAIHYILEVGETIDIEVDGGTFTIEKCCESGEIIIYPDEQTLN